MNAKNLTAALAVAMLLMAVGSVQAAVITWSSGMTYVSTDGVAAHAYAQLIPGTVVDAKYVTKSALGTKIVADTVHSRNISFTQYHPGDAGGDFGTAAPTTGDAILNRVLEPGNGSSYYASYQGLNSGNPLVLSGLTVGHNYQLQVFTGTDMTGYAGDEASLTYYSGTTSPYPTWFVTGTFTATGATQDLWCWKGPWGSPYPRCSISAYIVAEQVPEPSTPVLLGMGLLGLLARRRLRA